MKKGLIDSAHTQNVPDGGQTEKRVSCVCVYNFFFSFPRRRRRRPRGEVKRIIYTHKREKKKQVKSLLKWKPDARAKECGTVTKRKKKFIFIFSPSQHFLLLARNCNKRTVSCGTSDDTTIMCSVTHFTNSSLFMRGMCSGGKTLSIIAQ